MNVQPILRHCTVHVFDRHLQAVWAADSVADGVGEAGQAIVRAVLGSSKHGQVDDLLGHVGVCCYLCWYFWSWDGKMKTQVLLNHNFREVFCHWVGGFTCVTQISGEVRAEEMYLLIIQDFYKSPFQNICCLSRLQNSWWGNCEWHLKFMNKHPCLSTQYFVLWLHVWSRDT